MLEVSLQASDPVLISCQDRSLLPVRRINPIACHYDLCASMEQSRLVKSASQQRDGGAPQLHHQFRNIWVLHTQCWSTRVSSGIHCGCCKCGSRCLAPPMPVTRFMLKACLFAAEGSLDHWETATIAFRNLTDSMQRLTRLVLRSPRRL